MNFIMNRAPLCLATVLLVVAAVVVDARMSKPRDKNTIPCAEDKIPGNENKARAYQLLVEAANNLVEALPVTSLNAELAQTLNNIYDNPNLYGYGKTQLYVREADNMLKSHHATNSKYDHL